MILTPKWTSEKWRSGAARVGGTESILAVTIRKRDATERITYASTAGRTYFRFLGYHRVVCHDEVQTVKNPTYSTWILRETGGQPRVDEGEACLLGVE